MHLTMLTINCVYNIEPCGHGLAGSGAVLEVRSPQDTVNVEIFAWGNFRVFVFFAKITPTRNVWPTLSANFPPAKITTFTVRFT